MSLARSASVPGGLTINTGAANTLGPSTSQPSAPAAGLFGSGSSSANLAPPPSTAGMASTGGLFGGLQPKPGSSLFGATTQATAAASKPQTAATGGLFGGLAPSNQQAQQTAGTGGGLFGGLAPSNQQAQQTAGTGGGLFGSVQTQQQNQQPSYVGLFAKPNAPQQQTTGGGLFGASTTANTQANTAGGGLFGQSQPKPSGGLFGQTQTQQPQSTTQVPAVQIKYDSIGTRTRFDDLAKPVQDEIALIDKGIQRVIKMKDEIGEFMPQHEKDIEQLGRDVQFVEAKFKTVHVALNSDIQTVKILQDMTKKNIADAQLSFKATDNLKLPAHYHQTGLFAGPSSSATANGSNASSAQTSAQDLITYFNRICDEVEKYKKRLDEYRAEIERDMPGVENGLYEQIRSLRDRKANSGSAQDQLGQVLSALRETGNAIVAQAGQIADTRERLSRLQAGIISSGAYTMSMAS